MNPLHQAISLFTGRVPTPRLKNLLEVLPHWERHEFVLCGSAALAFRGVRDIGDLDVLVHPDLGKKLDRQFLDRDQYPWSFSSRLREQDIDVFWEVPRIRATFAEVLAVADDFHGYRVMCLRQVLAIKALVPERRTKDMEDMVKLSKLIAAEDPPKKYHPTSSIYR